MTALRGTPPARRAGKPARATERDAPARAQHPGTAIDRLLEAASGLAATIATTDALLQERADILNEPMVAMRPTARSRFGLVPLSEAATRIGRHPEVLRRWCADGKVNGIRIGRTWWLRSETVATLAAHGSRSRPRIPAEHAGNGR